MTTNVVVVNVSNKFLDFRILFLPEGFLEHLSGINLSLMFSVYTTVVSAEVIIVLFTIQVSLVYFSYSELSGVLTCLDCGT